jgi:hypothetical protein
VTLCRPGLFNPGIDVPALSAFIFISSSFLLPFGAAYSLLLSAQIDTEVSPGLFVGKPGGLLEDVSCALCEVNFGDVCSGR